MALLLATNALGTRVELAIDARETPALRAAAEAAIDEVRLWHDRLSRFSPDSYLSHINRQAAHGPVPLDEDCYELLRLCGDVHRRSGGAFDPTVGAGSEGEWASVVALDDRARTIRFSHPGARIDLGGVAKGFALDLAAAVLRRNGVESALMHAGTSSVVVLGPSERTIGVRSAAGVGALVLAEGALSVSAPIGRAVGRGSDILDPRAGRRAVAADTAVVATDRTGSAAEADAWSTALVVLGRRPPAMPGRLRAAIHDGRGWRDSNLAFADAPEAA